MSLVENRMMPGLVRRLFVCVWSVLPMVSALSVERRENTIYFPAWSGGGERLVYSSNRTGDWEIYVLDVAQRKETRLTHNSATDLGPAVNPVDSSIVFWSNRSGKAQLYSLEPTTGRTSALSAGSSNDRWPSWSPDGQWIAFVSDRSGEGDLYVMAANGGAIRGLTTGLKGPFRPRWAPDGAALICTAESDGNQEIFLVQTENGKCENLSNTANINEGNPAISPNGRYIIFDAHAKGKAESGDGKWELYLMARDGGQRRRLTRNNMDDWCPAWHPRERRVAYLSGRDNANYRLRILDIESLVSRMIQPRAE